MKITTKYVHQGSELVQQFFNSNFDCNIFTNLEVVDDPSLCDTDYLKHLYKSYKYVQKNFDKLCAKLFRVILPQTIKDNIIGILFDLPIYINGKEKWSIGFTCPNKHPLKAKATKWAIVVSIYPTLEKFGGKHANVIYLMHEIGHVYQNVWFGNHLTEIKQLKESQINDLRDLTHAIIEWLVDYRFGRKFGLQATGHKALEPYRQRTKEIFNQFLHNKKMTIFDCFNECMREVKR